MHLRCAAVVVFALGTGLAVCPAALRAQRQETPQVPRAVFRSGTEYVAVDVVVTGAHDQPVTDLTAPDFEIREGGRLQQIRDFDHVSIPIVRRAVDLKATPAPRPDVASNAAPPRTSRAFVFVIDDGAVLAEDVVKLKRVMTEFLQTLSPADRVAVVYIRRSDLAQDFTSDMGQIVRAVNRINTAIGWSPDARATRLVLGNVIGALAAVPETRRVVVYVSSGFQICDPMNPMCAGLDGPPSKFTTHGLQDLFDRARAADVPIYTVDPHGLVAPDLNLGGHLEDQTPANRYAVDIRARALQDFMRTLPENTGGLAFTNTNTLAAAVDDVMADNGDYYVLGYSPSPYAADEKFHEIEVRVVTRPGLHVRARKGYVASKAAVTPDAHAALLGVVGDPQPHSDLGLRAFAAPVAAAAHGATAIVTLDVTYPAAMDGPPRADDDLQLAFVAVDPDGKIMKSEPRAFHVSLGGATRDALTLSLDDTLDLPKGKWTVRIGVSSRVLGTVGTVHVPIEIQDFAGSSAAASPLVLGLVTGATEVVGRPGAIATLVPFQPTTRRSFSRDQQVRVFARVFIAKPGDVTAELRLTRGTTIVRTIPVRVTPSPTGGTARDCDATLALGDVPPGSYALQLIVHGKSGQVTPPPVGIEVR